MPLAGNMSPRRGPRGVMLITQQRVAYLGLLGNLSTRVFGAIAVYLPVDAPCFEIRRQGGDWEPADFAVIPPYEHHHIRSEGKLVICLLLEMESVDVDAAMMFLTTGAAEIAARIRFALAHLQATDSWRDSVRLDFDELFFGRRLPARELDRRIAAVIDRVCADPAAHFSVAELSRICKLSESRFIHLVKSQIGTTFRCFCAWKRARSFLAYANATISATEVALDAGYPDSTHFRHSIRKFYGCKPTDIFSGSRRLDIIRPTGTDLPKN